MKRIATLMSLITIIIVCSIISVTYYPSKMSESYVNILTYPQFFLMVKNFAYDTHSIKHFYSYNSITTPTLNSLSLPTFFAISPLCSESNVVTNYDCLDYNINSISIENKALGNVGLKICTSIDNFSSPNDALAYTLRIKDDTFTVHKNCLLSERIVLTSSIRIQPPRLDSSITGILDKIMTSGISNGFQNEAFSLALFSDNATDPEYTTEYNIQIYGSKLCKFIVLARPLFIKIGMSGLYKINYTTKTTGNTINSYSSETNEAGSLSLKLRRVCDKRIYSSSAMTLSKAIEVLQYESISDVDCKPSSIIDPGNTFLNNYIQNTPAKVVETVPLVHFNTMLYYLTHTQNIENSNSSTTSCISIFFSELDFVSTENTIFSFSSSNISTIYENGIFTIKIANFGVSSEEIRIANPYTKSVSLMCTWSDNRLNLAVFYMKDDNTHLMFQSLETINNCSFIKSAFSQACVAYKCTISPGKCNTFVSMHNIAISRNLI